jgi:hypothetical protein
MTRLLAHARLQHRPSRIHHRLIRFITVNVKWRGFGLIQFQTWLGTYFYAAGLHAG